MYGALDEERRSKDYGYGPMGAATGLNYVFVEGILCCMSAGSDPRNVQEDTSKSPADSTTLRFRSSVCARAGVSLNCAYLYFCYGQGKKIQ